MTGKSWPSAQWSSSDWKTEKLQTYWSPSAISSSFTSSGTYFMPGAGLRRCAGRSARRWSRSCALRLEVEQAEVEHRLRLLLDLLRVVQRLHAVLLREVALEIEHVADLLRDRARATSSGIGGLSFSIAPKASTTSTEWCATIARPLSQTMVGCATFSESQTSMMFQTMSRAYSASE